MLVIAVAVMYKRKSKTYIRAIASTARFIATVVTAVDLFSG